MQYSSMQKKLLTKLANARLRSVLTAQEELATAVIGEDRELTAEAQLELWDIEQDFERAATAIKKYWGDSDDTGPG